MLHRGLWVRKACWLAYCKMQPGALGHILGVLHLIDYVLVHIKSFPVIGSMGIATHPVSLSKRSSYRNEQSLITPPSSTCCHTQPAPLCAHISLFPPLQSLSLHMGVTNMLGQVQQRITAVFTSELRLVSLLRNGDSDGRCH